MTKEDTNELSQDIIDSLVVIGNAKKVKQACEPGVVEPAELKEWMIIRTLMARGLFMQELERINKEDVIGKSK